MLSDFMLDIDIESMAVLCYLLAVIAIARLLRFGGDE